MPPALRSPREGSDAGMPAACNASAESTLGSLRQLLAGCSPDSARAATRDSARPSRRPSITAELTHRLLRPDRASPSVGDAAAAAAAAATTTSATTATSATTSTTTPDVAAWKPLGTLFTTPGISIWHDSPLRPPEMTPLLEPPAAKAQRSMSFTGGQSDVDYYAVNPRLVRTLHAPEESTKTYYTVPPPPASSLHAAPLAPVSEVPLPHIRLPRDSPRDSPRPLPRPLPRDPLRSSAVADDDDDDDGEPAAIRPLDDPAAAAAAAAPLSVSRAFRFPYAPRRSSASPLTERSISLSLDPAPRRHSVAFTPSHTPEIKHKVPYRGPSPASQPASPSTADPADHVRSDLKIAAAQVDRYFSSDDHRTRAREIVALCPPGSVPGRTTPTAPGAAYKSLHIVEFKACRTDVFFVPEESQLVLRTGDLVIVEADRGRDLGKIVRDNVTMVQVRALKAQQQRDQLAAMNQEFTAAPSDPLVNPKVIHRMAQPNEVNMLISKSQDENHAMSVCQGKVLQRLMPMEVLDAEYQWDRRKLTFFYYASQRIDFRELVRDLYKVFKIRIWMCAVNPGITSNLNQSIGPPGAIGQRLATAPEQTSAPPAYHPATWGLPAGAPLHRMYGTSYANYSWPQPAAGGW